VAIYKDKKGLIALGDNVYPYRYIERGWNILGNSELENIAHTSLHGTVHEVILIDTDLCVEFPDGKKIFVSTVGVGDSFDACVKQLNDYYRLYQIAQVSSSVDEARAEWRKSL
jgi:hypothetical protein